MTTHDACAGCGFVFLYGTCLHTDGKWWTVCPSCGRTEPRGTSHVSETIRFERRTDA